MLRFARICNNNFSRHHQLQCLSTRYISTAVEEGDLLLKTGSSEEIVISNKELFKNDFANAEDIPSLLKSATDKYKVDYAFKALDMLANWSEVKKITFEEVEKDENYPKLVSVIEKQANNRHAIEIINALKNLKRLGVPDTNFVFESLENDLLWNVRKVSVHSLLLILIFQSHHQATERQKKVLDQTLLAIERRWTEVKNAHDFCLIYGLSNCFNTIMMGNIDDKVIDSAGKMSFTDLSKVMISISTSKRRPTPVLRSLAFHMFKKSDKLSPKQISNLAYAMNSLNFPDEALFGKMSTDFLSQIDQVDQPSIIGTLLLCMGQMRWRDKFLIDAMADWVIKNIDICRHSDIASLILTMASVSYTPNNIDEIVSVCVPRLVAEGIPEKAIWVNIVWSLTVLEKATNKQISSVLDPSFVKDIPTNDQSSVGTFLKLFNINAAADILLDSYNGNKLHLPKVDIAIITRSRKDLSLHSFIQKVLRNFLPPPKYLRESVKTDMGFTVEAEIIMDKHCKPLIVSDYSTAFGEIESLKPLPEGAHRIALMVWNFKDFTIGSHSLTGQNSLAVKLLNKKGYKVVEIPFYDINKNEKTITNIQYFERKINETINS